MRGKERGKFGWVLPIRGLRAKNQFPTTVSQSLITPLERAQNIVYIAGLKSFEEATRTNKNKRRCLDGVLHAGGKRG